MAAIDGQVALGNRGTAIGRTADRPVHPSRRLWLAAGVAGLLPLALQGCGTTRPRDTAAARRAAPPTPELAALGTEIVLQAMAQVGKPYRWGGADPAEGFDCSGLVLHVYRDAVGVRLPRTSREMGRTGDGVSAARLVDGDLVFFNTLRRPFSHVGIYVGEGRFVHSPSARSRVRLDRIDARYWADRFDGGRRILGTRIALGAKTQTAAVTMISTR